MKRTTRAVTVAALLLVGVPVLGQPALSAPPRTPPGQGPVPSNALYPTVGAGTDLVDQDAALAGMPEPDWYKANIPFVDLPDQAVEDTYYYRWRTYKEALKYTGPENGWITSEFLGPVGYSAPDGGISAAAGHHVYEGRWLRDSRYVDDYVDYWLTGSGSGPKPATDGLNENTTDWAHQYSFWAADAVLAQASVDGDLERATGLLPELEEQWKGWAPQFNPDLGLYWQTPVWDAMEFTASSYQSDDPYHGGDGYRPTLNAYQYGDAKAIAALASRTGDKATAAEYEQAAANLQAAQEKWLWDEGAGFYKHVMRDGNPDHTKLVDREQIGFIPWYFHMAPAANSRAWAQLTDPQGFAAAYGPTTVERRSPWFMHEALNGCCRWDGPSWPYATSQTLTAMGNLLADYPAQPYVDNQDFADLLHSYALTQRKDGKPYVAEAHHPDEDRWLYDGRNHSEDYNHSTFNDIVLSDLVGIDAQADDSVRIAPLVPASWDHFAVDNVAYHGRNLSVSYDRDGSVYGRGSGLQVHLDGQQVHTQAGLDPVVVPVPAVKATQQLAAQVDDAANVDGVGYPKASASYTWANDAAAEAIDGQDFHLDVPSTRWTTYRSPNQQDSLVVDFGVPTPVSDVRIDFYDDGGGVRTPASYALQYRDAAGGWVDLPDQQRTPRLPVGRQINRVLLGAPVTTDALRLVLTPQPGSGVGVTAFQSWRSVNEEVEASIVTPTDGIVPIRAGGTVDVQTSLTAQGNQRVTSDQLLAPRGWTVQRVGAANDKRQGGTRLTTWRVTAPADADPTADSPLRYLVALATPGQPWAGDIAATRWTFDPATFGAVAFDDDFSTDRLGQYGVSGAFGEQPPALAVADGALTATAGARGTALISAPAAASGERFAVIVEPRSFAGTGAAEDSLFLGAAGSSSDFALGWYNNSRSESGVNVVVGGRGRPEAEGPGSRAVTWAPGDRFAAVFVSGGLTTWIEHEGTWRRINAAPVSAAVSPQTLASWSPAVGLRLDPGQIAVDRLTVLK